MGIIKSIFVILIIILFTPVWILVLIWSWIETLKNRHWNLIPKWVRLYPEREHERKTSKEVKTNNLRRYLFPQRSWREVRRSNASKSLPKAKESRERSGLKYLFFTTIAIVFTIVVIMIITMLVEFIEMIGDVIIHLRQSFHVWMNKRRKKWSGHIS